MSFSMLHSSMLPPHDHQERDGRDSTSSSASHLDEEGPSSMLHSSMLPPHDHQERDDRDSAPSSASDHDEEDASDTDEEDERLCAIWGRPEHDNYPEEASDSDSSD